MKVHDGIYKKDSKRLFRFAIAKHYAVHTVYCSAVLGQHITEYQMNWTSWSHKKATDWSLFFLVNNSRKQLCSLLFGGRFFFAIKLSIGTGLDWISQGLKRPKRSQKLFYPAFNLRILWFEKFHEFYESKSGAAYFFWTSVYAILKFVIKNLQPPSAECVGQRALAIDQCRRRMSN